MARKKQQLINYHTGSLTSMPLSGDVQLGELVVRHATDKPELLIKKDNNEFATFIDSASIDGKLTTLKTYIDGQIDSLESASTSDLKAFSATVVNTYATSADTESAIATAKSEAVSSGKGYTDGQISAVTSAYTKADADLASSIEAVSGSVSAFSATVVNDYATKVIASGYAMTAEAAAIAAAAASADTLNTSIETVDGKVDTLSGNVENLKTDLTNTINEKVARAYRYQGSCTYAKLPESGSVIGEVWNVTDANGNYPAGTNYAWNGTEWDALGGSVDLSPYALKTEVTGATKTLQDNIDAANRRIDIVSGDLNTFKTYVANTYETKDNVSTAITAAKDSVYLSATTVAAADATAKANKAKEDAITAAAASADTLNTSIETVDDRVDTVSASLNTFKTDVANTYETKDNVATAITSVYSSATTVAAADAKKKADAAYSSAVTAAAASAETLNNSIEAVKTTADKAVQTASIVDSDSKVSVSKVDTELKFDFSNLVVDCGEF